MANPVLIELTRGHLVESVHTGAIAIARADGTMHLSLGDCTKPIYPRSAVKAFQAIPLIETGAADRYSFDDRALALACASHSGDDRHADLAQWMLGQADLAESHLACGAHHAMDEGLARRHVSAGRKPTQLQNNCSGKHAGMLATCSHCGDPPQAYLSPEHPHQQRIMKAMAEMCGDGFAPDRFGIDGCSAPNWAVPLKDLARAFARFISGENVPTHRRATNERLARACMAEPFYVAGDKRLDTVAMARTPGKVFLKTGAEGVYCAAMPDLGLGVALKIDDGHKRASEAVIEAILDRLLPPQVERLGALGPQVNWRGIETGHIRRSEALARALDR